MTCGEKIATLRRNNNYTQEQFAELLKVSRQSVSKWETNSAYPDTEKLIKMSKLFSCSIDYLLKDEIENLDVTQTSESELANRDYYKGMFLTYLSFPPLFGFIVAIFSIRHQKTTMHNNKCLVLSMVGMCFSLALTIIMLIGIIFGL